MPRLVVKPLQEFLSTSTASATLLLAAALAALVWANSPWSNAYEHLWETGFTLRLGRWALHEDLRHWVNDALMSLFFLVVGLEIKRELLTGELREWRAAALPAVAAVGGMVLPALLYFALNAGTDAARGWGVPMATDIAFALGVLTLAARYAPANVKPFLLTLAIVDDIGAIIVIALFYSGGIELLALGVSLLSFLLIVVLQRVHVRTTVAYVALGAAAWVAMFESGVHPTIAGVVLGLLTPSVPFQRPAAVSREAVRVADDTVDDPDPPDADAPHWFHLATLSREAVSPLARVEHLLLPWTSFVILPLFALANAGVVLSADGVRAALSSAVTLGVVLGLLVGKAVGIWLASIAAVRVRLAALPPGVRFPHVFGTATVAGIGFTVSLFIAELAFEEGSTIQTEAKIGILFGSVIAGVAGYLLLRAIPTGAVSDEEDASASGDA